MAMAMEAVLKLIQINPYALVGSRHYHVELKEHQRLMMQFLSKFYFRILIKV